MDSISRLRMTKAGLLAATAVLLLSTSSLMAALDPSAIPTLLVMLHENDTTNKLRAIRALEALGPRAAVAIPDLLDLLNGQTTGPVLQALAHIVSPQSTSAIPFLTPSLRKCADKRSCDQLADILARAGPDATQVLLAIALEHNESPHPALAVLRTMARQGPLPLLTIPVLVQAQSDESIRMLADIGEPAVPELVAILVRDVSALRPGSAEIYALSRIATVVNALGEIGSSAADAIPAMLQAFKYTILRIEEWRNRPRPLFDTRSVEERMKIDPPFAEQDLVRQAILRSLPRVADARAVNELPDLETALNDEDYLLLRFDEYATFNTSICEALRKIAPRSIPVLVRALQSRNVETRLAATKALVEVAPSGEVITRALLDIAGSPGPGRLEAAAVRAALIGGERGLDSIVSFLQSGDAEVRWEAAKILGAFGSVSRPALPALLSAINDTATFRQTPRFGVIDEVQVRHGVLEALGKIGDPSALPVLIAALKDDQAYSVAQSGLAGFGAQVVPQLVDTMIHERWQGFAFNRALNVLEEIGPSAQAAVEFLVRIPDQASKHAAATVIPKIVDRRSVGAVPLIVEMLNQRDPEIRRSALAALRAIGPGAKAAVPALIPMTDEYEFEASEVLITIGAAALPQLVEALGNADPKTNGALNYVAVTIAQRNSETAANYLIDALAADKTATRAGVLLLSIGRSVVPDLAEALSDTRAKVRMFSLITLGIMGPAADPAIPAITAATKDKDPAVAYVARLTLRNVQSYRFIKE